MLVVLPDSGPFCVEHLAAGGSLAPAMESIHPPQMDVFGGASNAKSKTRTNLARPGPKLHNVRRNTFQHIAGLRTDFPGRLGRFQIDGIIVFLLRARGTLPPPPTRLVVSRSGSDARVPSVWV